MWFLGTTFSITAGECQFSRLEKIIHNTHLLLNHVRVRVPQTEFVIQNNTRPWVQIWKHHIETLMQNNKRVKLNPLKLPLDTELFVQCSWNCLLTKVNLLVQRQVCSIFDMASLLDLKKHAPYTSITAQKTSRHAPELNIHRQNWFGRTTNIRSHRMSWNSKTLEAKKHIYNKSILQH